MPTRAVGAWTAGVLLVAVVAAVSGVSSDEHLSTATPGAPTSPAVHTSGTVGLPATTTIVTAPTATAAAPAVEVPATDATGSTPNSLAPTQGPDDGSTIGSVLDLDPGPVVPHTPAPCTDPSTHPSPPGLAILDVARGCLRVLVEHDEVSGPDVSWAPDGTWLVVTLDLHVVRIAADGSWRQDLGGAGQAERVALSPDGTRLAIIGNVPCCYLSQKAVLVVANADGTGATVAQDDIGRWTEGPVWSRDSRFFAYVGRDRGYLDDPHHLRVFTAAGALVAETSLPDRGSFNAMTGEPTPASIGEPSWTAGSVLAVPVFVDRPTYQSLIWLDVELRELPGPTAPTGLVNGVSSSPDGNAVLYAASDPDNGNHQTAIGLLDRATGESRLIAHAAIAPSLSPDGTRYAYATADFSGGVPQAATITIADFAGNATALWTVTNANCSCWLDRPPVWSADGTALAIASPMG
jgi:dipeptidyl aminopeptidase/acylaminoacyl peptidase